MIIKNLKMNKNPKTYIVNKTKLKQKKTILKQVDSINCYYNTYYVKASHTFSQKKLYCVNNLESLN